MSGGLENLTDVQLQELKAAGGDVAKLSDATLHALQSANKPPSQSLFDKALTGINTGVNWASTQIIKGATGVAGMPRVLADYAQSTPQTTLGEITRGALKFNPVSGPMVAAGSVLPSTEGMNEAIFAPGKAEDRPNWYSKPTAVHSGIPILDSAAQAMAGGFLFPGGGTIRGAASNALGGATGEVAGELTKGTWAEPYARMVGGGFGTLAPNIPQMIRSTAPAMVARRTADMTRTDWDAAKQFQAEANARGVPLMAHEAMTPDRTSPLAQLFGDVSASPSGAPIRKFARDRLPGINAAIGREADALAPPIGDPKAVDIALAQAADKAVRAPKSARSAEATPGYAAARPGEVDVVIPKQIVAAIDDSLTKVNPAGAAAARLREMRAMVARGGSDPMPRALDTDIAGFKLPDGTKQRMMRDRYPIKPPIHETNIGRLDEVFTQFDQLMKQRAFDPTKQITEAARVEMQPIIGDLRSKIMQANADYRKGVEIYKGTPGQPSPWTTAVQQAEQSGAGQIASAYQGKPDQARGLFGKWIMDPDNARPATVRADIARLNAQDPNAAKAALRLYVENIADAAFQRTQAGSNIEAGSKFTKAIAGTPTQRANVVAAVEAATGNQTTAAGFAKLIDILDRTGVTPNIGSPTATRGMTAVEASSGGVLGTALDSANLMRGGPLGPATRWVRDLYYRRAFGDLADLTTSPDGVKQLHALALLNPESAKAKALVQTIVQGALSTQRGSVRP